jgi:hypothetical protein
MLEVEEGDNKKRRGSWGEEQDIRKQTSQLM